MPGYGQFCPIAQAADVISERWTPLVIRELALGGSRRFNDIQRGVPLMSSISANVDRPASRPRVTAEA